MTRYRLTSDAERDLETIKTYLLQQGGARLVRHVFTRMQRALNFLAEAPDAGHRRENLTAAPVKFWTVFSYMIIYDPAARPITIVRVLHGNRDISTMLRQ
jgi:antitoxin ParD1/3/4/toxin ParE1/3/4